MHSIAGSKWTRTLVNGAMLLFLALMLTSCATLETAPLGCPEPPASLTAPTPIPEADAKTNDDLAKLYAETVEALARCNIDKAKLRK